jgi:putative ABC transport system permease protein
LRPAKLHRDIERELSFHVRELADELRSEGLDEEEAMRRARARFGNASVYTERTRDADIAVWAEAQIRNVRYAFRAIWRTPGFSLTVVLTLALDIGANGAVFSALDAVLIRELPFPDAERLVLVRQVWDAETPIAPVRLEDWSRSSSTLESLTGYYVEDVSDTTGDLPERVRRAVVAPRFLDVFGVSPALGRGFVEAEYRSAGGAVVLVSDRYWRGRLGADPDVLSRTVRIEDRSYSIVGVMPKSFQFLDRDVDLWWPTPVDSPWVQDTSANRTLQWYTGIGRIKPDVTLGEARADLALVQARLGERYPETDSRIGIVLLPLKETVVGEARASLLLLFGAVSVLLLIACTNIAALLLARAAQREREIALRFSLGASRQGVAAQLLTEIGLLALAGAALGVLVAHSASAAYRVLAPELPRLDEVAIDGRILVYVALATIVVTFLCGLVPALQVARGKSSLTRPGRQVSSGHRLSWLLVGAQVALSVLLLGVAGLLVRSFEELSRVDPGFEPERVLAFRVSGHWAETVERARLLTRIEQMVGELQALPGVEAVATAWKLPGVPGSYQTEFELVEGRSEDEPPLAAEWRSVSPGYWETMRIGLLSGELCRRSSAGETMELLVNRSFVDRYFASRSALGMRLSWEEASLSGPILGVVDDVRELGVDRAAAPTVYSCDAAPNPFPWILLRTKGEPGALAASVRAKIHELEPLRSVFDLAPLEERIGDAYGQNRMHTALLASFAGTALALACLGIYATLGYVVSLRRREVGLRLALGAERRDIVSGILWQGLRVVGPACALGLALALLCARLLSGMLYGVSPSDPSALGGAIGVVFAVSLLAALAPALRAARVEPISVLRQE